MPGWSNWHAPWGSMGWSGIAGFILSRSGGRWVHPLALGSLTCALVSLGSCGVAYARPGGRSDPTGSLVHTVGRWVYPVSLGSLALAPLVSLGSFGVVGFTRAHPWCGWVHSRSLDSLGCALVVYGFIWGSFVHSCAPLASLRSTWVVGFSRSWTVCRCVHLGSLDSLAHELGVVEVIRSRWFH